MNYGADSGSMNDELVVRDTSQISDARVIVRAAACSLGLDDKRADDAALVVSELVTNALEHGGVGDVVVSTVVDARSLLVTVSSAMSENLPARPQKPEAVSSRRGRGLGIVEALTDGFTIELRSGSPGTAIVRCRFAVTW
jgi:anti-sigma regulatory factor (Ser/Thr protein kinase)